MYVCEHRTEPFFLALLLPQGRFAPCGCSHAAAANQHPWLHVRGPVPVK